jgi:hypothetical protein
METGLLDTIGVAVAVILTLFVFSYLLEDNILFRLAEHIFVGVALGYAAIIVFRSVLAFKLFIPLVDAAGQSDWSRFLLLSIPLVLGLLLLTKPLKSVSLLGNISVAVLLGVGAALSIGGALFGTLLPQANATADVTRYGPGLGLFSGLVVLAGATGVLLHFYFGSGTEGRTSGLRDRLVAVWGGLGRWFIVVTFAAILAAMFVSRLSFLVGWIEILLNGVRGLVGG